MTTLENPDVVHNAAEKRFEIQIGEYLAELDYLLEGKVITFTHTGVPMELEGRGLGSKLVKAGLAYAQAQGYRVRPLCSFVAGYIQKHPEYQALLA
jgi:hypothetical protein